MVGGFALLWAAQGVVHPPSQYGIRDLRDLMRYRKTLVQQRATEINRIQKVLETTNIKLSSVARDVMGKSGCDMIEAVIAGQEDQEALADLARGSLPSKKEDLRKALEGRVKPYHQLLLHHLLDHINFLDATLLSMESARYQSSSAFT